MSTVGMMLRLPLDVRNWLKVTAEENCRSMNGEIVALLKKQMAAPQKENAPTAATVEAFGRTS